ncbi:hypothetical protein [Sphingorhabdus sp.]|uniref:hypothetical protein n=1 Tax=Sphingorhabdus sp. TaxID=1902408 RepID=UPI002FDA537C
MNTAEILRAYDALRADYADYAAESRACGYEVASFEHWAGLSCPKADAQARLIDIDSPYYHCD